MNKEVRTARPARLSRRPGRDGIIDRGQTDWYKDAIIYQLHVKAFQDADNDGLGDFAGLIQRLDHVQSLGVNTIWLLPFYPSPLRDDGYDIADYRSINPSYGRMRDFTTFVREAHERGLRVITELVINHTSDAHPWFQRARHAKPGSAARDFYVWSDTDDKYPETRIIFLDTEKSNWTWDPVAKAYFWHRFYSHQPDLNFDNPRVLREVIRVLHFWLEMGVDGLRLDAIPYLIEREGTNNENLPETHTILKMIRAEVDAHFPDRMLLAEANQWPEDTRPYFGDGDECHMAFHFPLMPRIYMGLAQEDRHPITDIIRQTPELPESCQWAIFLRNHDELTLEMVTNSERDYLWNTYAADRRARINLGIRRRLAPLMQNDRRKIELLNGLLLSMPGTPVIYYGDEIGMGDNYYLGDRDGVRTPMHWSADRNAGFSRAPPQALYLPPIMDPVYGYEAINVEAQQSEPSSLLNWMRRMVGVRMQHPAFGRGSMEILYPANRKILAYVREHDGEAILCVANLSRAAQAVELDLSHYRDAIPIELSGRSSFPPIGDLPYLMTLPAYGFYWFLLAPEGEMPAWHTPVPEPLPEFITLAARDARLSTALDGRGLSDIAAELPKFLRLQRWFAAKDAAIRSIEMRPLVELASRDHMIVEIDLETDRGPQTYHLPLSVRWGEENLRHGAPKLSYTLARIRKGANLGAIIDGASDEDFATRLLAQMRSGGSLKAGDARVVFDRTDQLADMELPESARPLGAEQSNVSIIFDGKVILKLYRRLRSGPQPDVEVARFLTETAGFGHTPPYLGSAAIERPGREPTTIAAAYAFVMNQGDAWQVVLDALSRELEESALQSDPDGEIEISLPFDLGSLIGRRTAELHAALATRTDDPAFACEPMTPGDLEVWSTAALAEAEDVMSRLAHARPGLSEDMAGEVDAFLASKRMVLSRLRAVARLKTPAMLSRIHGDYHLGQVLVAQNDLQIIDFEGEPGRDLAERRIKSSPLRDVAGMLRSLDYVAAAALARQEERIAEADPLSRERVENWRDQTISRFLDAYFEAVEGTPTVPDRPAAIDALLTFFTIHKAVYEIGYELANRPAWLAIPLGGIRRLIERDRRT